MYRRLGNTNFWVHVKSITDFVVTLRCWLTKKKLCVAVWVLCVYVPCPVYVLAVRWCVDERSVFQASAVQWIDRYTASEWLWLTLLCSLSPLTRGWEQRVHRGREGDWGRTRNLLNVRIGARWQSMVQHCMKMERYKGMRRENRQTDGLIVV